MAILMRRGADADFDASKIQSGELAVTTDGTEKIYVGFAKGKAKELVKKETFESEIGQLSEQINALPGSAIICTAEGESIAVTDSSDAPLKGLKIFGRTEQGDNPSIDNPQELVNVGASGELKVDVYSGNILPFTNKDTTTRDGITYTVNNDMSVTVSGTATAQSFHFLVRNIVLKKGTYTVSGCPSGGNKSTYCQFITHNGEYNILPVDTGNGATFTLDENAVIGVHINVSSGVTINKTFYPMLNTGSVKLPYEPYKPQQTLTSYINGGLCGIPVTDASLATYTDASGQMWAANYIDYETGEYVQVVAMDELTEAEYHIENIGFYCKLKTQTSLTDSVGKCTHKENNILFAFNKAGAYTHYVFNKKTYFTDINNFNTWAQAQKDAGTPLRVAYILTTPIRTKLTKAELEAYKALRTNYPTTTVLNDAGAHMAIKYNADTKLYIDNKFAALAAAMV